MNYSAIVSWQSTGNSMLYFIHKEHALSSIIFLPAQREDIIVKNLLPTLKNCFSNVFPKNALLLQQILTPVAQCRNEEWKGFNAKNSNRI